MATLRTLDTWPAYRYCRNMMERPETRRYGALLITLHAGSAVLRRSCGRQLHAGTLDDCLRAAALRGAPAAWSDWRTM